MVSAWLGAFAFIVASSDSVAIPSPVVASPETPIRITLNSDGYFDHGDRARVRVRLADDGYLVVLRADADGRVRVLFPLDPGDDDFVRGGKDYELRGRGDRETFYVDDRDGTGTVLAAWSSTPFRYERFVRGDHWDYRVLVDEQVVQRVRDDTEGGLLDLVTEMADSAHFDYDVVSYTVGSGARMRRPYAGYYGYPCYGCGGYGYGSGIRIGFFFGRSYRYCDPFLYDPFFCDSYYYDPFYPGFYRPYHWGVGYSCFRDPYCGYRRSIYTYGRTGGGFVFKRPPAPPPLVLPRQRIPVRSAGVTERARDGAGFGGRREIAPSEPRRRATAERGATERPRERSASPSRGSSPSRGASPARGSSPSRGASPARGSSPSRGASPARGSSPSRGASPSRGSSSSRGSGSRPSNSGSGRRH